MQGLIVGEGTHPQPDAVPVSMEVTARRGGMRGAAALGLNFCSCELSHHSPISHLTGSPGPRSPSQSTAVTGSVPSGHRGSLSQSVPLESRAVPLGYVTPAAGTRFHLVGSRADHRLQLPPASRLPSL